MCVCVCIKLNPTLESERQEKRRNQPSRAGHRMEGASATYLGIPIVVHDDKV